VSSVVPAHECELVDQRIDEMGPDETVAAEAVAEDDGRALAHATIPEFRPVVGGVTTGVVHAFPDSSRLTPLCSKHERRDTFDPVVRPPA
jgi:hypothetical protein